MLYNSDEMCWLEALVENARGQKTLLRSQSLVELLRRWEAADLPAGVKEVNTSTLAKLREEAAETIALLASGRFTWVCHEPGLFRIIPGEPVSPPPELLNLN